MENTPDNLGKRLKERYDALEQIRRPWETLWSDVSKYIMPRRSPGMSGTVMLPSTTESDALFDTTAVRANMTLANGQLAWMSPMESPWFAFEPPDGIEDDEARRWLAKASKTARDKLAHSNFYLAVHEFYLDRGGFGTACIYVEKIIKNGVARLSTQHWPIGTYVLDEDSEGLVDTVIRKFKLSARQAVQKFGLDNVSEKVRLAYDDPKKSTEKFDYLHAIYPRTEDERDPQKMDAVNMPWASVYLEFDGDNKVCLNGGHTEQPVFVSRYLEWGTGLGGMYGWCPAFVALPEARQVNFLQMWMDMVAERLADPPWLAPDELEGEIDTNARGVTYFSRDLAAANALPRPMQADIGNVQALLERIKERQASINDAFHVDLFQMFAQIEKQMTAREVTERSQEKLIQFSPTFARMTNELFTPLLEREFSIGLSSGWFGEPPDSLRVPVTDTMDFVPPPAIQFSSRIALALRALPMLGYLRTLDRLAVVGQIRPDVMDNYDFDKLERAASLVDGVDPEAIVSMEQVQEIRTARAEAAQAQREQEQAMMAADAAAKVGKVPANSPVGQQISQALAA